MPTRGNVQGCQKKNEHNARGESWERVPIAQVKDDFTIKINTISSGQTLSLVITGWFAYEVSLKGSHSVQR